MKLVTEFYKYFAHENIIIIQLIIKTLYIIPLQHNRISMNCTEMLMVDYLYFSIESKIILKSKTPTCV